MLRLQQRVYRERKNDGTKIRDRLNVRVRGRVKCCDGYENFVAGEVEARHDKISLADLYYLSKGLPQSHAWCAKTKVP